MSAAARTLTWQADLLDDSLRTAARPQRTRLIRIGMAAGLLAAVGIALVQAQLGQLKDLRLRADAAEARLRHAQIEAGPETQARLTARRQLAGAVEIELADKRALAEALHEVFAALDPEWTASGVLRVLSQRHLEGLWLERIRVDRTRRELALEGMAPGAAEVSAYVAQLGAEDSLLARMQVSSVITERDPGRRGGNPAGVTETSDGAYLKFRVALKVTASPQASREGGMR